jgi:hypothetical protein
MMLPIAALSLLLLGSPQAAGTIISPQAPARDTSAIPKGTGSISGKVVTAEGGRPVRRVSITLSSPEFPGEPKTVSTNAQGRFEISELPAGRYSLTASRAGYMRVQYGQRRPGENGRPIQLADGQKFTTADFSLPRTAVIVGRITDEVGDPMPNASIFPMQWRYYRGQRRMVPVAGGGPFNRTDDTGGYRISGLEPGDYYVMATTRDAWTDEKNPKERIGFLPTYSGGTANPAEAYRLKVGLGQEVQMPEFSMVPGRVGTISGTAVSSSGLPLVGEQVSMSQEFSGPGSSSSFGMSGSKVAADGTWTIRNVSPGEYKLTLRSAAEGDRPPEGATTTIVFAGEDLTGIMLVTTTGATLRGRVITETGETLPRDHKMRVASRPVDTTRTFTAFDQDNGRVRDDMSFELKSVFGSSRLSISPVPPGWAVRSIIHEGKDLVDDPVEFRGGQQVEGLTVLLSKSMPRVRGTLLDERGTPVEASVVIFPEDPSKWSEQSRLIRSARPDHGGTFEFRDVVPGEYLLAPLDYVRDNDWSDPAFLEGLREGAKRVRVDDTGAASVALTLKKSQ